MYICYYFYSLKISLKISPKIRDYQNQVDFRGFFSKFILYIRRPKFQEIKNAFYFKRSCEWGKKTQQHSFFFFWSFCQRQNQQAPWPYFLLTGEVTGYLPGSLTFDGATSPSHYLLTNHLHTRCCREAGVLTGRVDLTLLIKVEGTNIYQGVQGRGCGGS